MQTADVQKNTARRAPRRNGFKKTFGGGERGQFVNQSRESVL